MMGSGAGFGNTKPKKSGISSVYDAAVSQQAGDYDNIMGNYDSLLANSQGAGANANTKLNYTPINPTLSNYKRSGDLNTAINTATGLSQTGGYSEADLGNIRERSISPIRSIYASAQEGMKRQKALQGGYSPNAGAVAAKMARESAGIIGGATTNANAKIAEMVAAGKLSGLNTLGSLSGRENELINQNEQFNANAGNRTNEFNAGNQLNVNQANNQAGNQNFNNQLNAIQGKQSLYGTTPALTQTFGNQVLANNAQNLQANQISNQLKNQRTNTGLGLVQSQLHGSGRGGVRSN